ncbi:MAG: hypothetical protein V8R40_02650 [Dysosmobacter sp.]
MRPHEEVFTAFHHLFGAGTSIYVLWRVAALPELVFGQCIHCAGSGDFIRIWLSQEDRLEAMEKRIKELEEQQVQKEKQE